MSSIDIENDIIVIENAISKNNFLTIKNYITGRTFNWHCAPDTAGAMFDGGVKEPSFANNLYKDDINNPIVHPFSDYFNASLIAAFDQNDIEFNQFIRIRCGLILGLNRDIVHAPHIDYTDIQHKTALLYLNDDPSFTYFYNKKHKIGDKLFSRNHFSENDIIFKCQPKENTLVVFDGFVYHSSSSSKESTARFAVNCNFN